MIKKITNLISKIDLASAKFKASILVLSGITFLIIFMIALSKFNTTDKVSELIPVNAKAIQELGPFAVSVKTGMYIKSFPLFDVIKNNFIFNAVVWFEFNSDEISLDIIKKFAFDQDNILYMSPPDIRVAENKVFAKFNMTVSLSTALNYHKFPFEDHQIPIQMTNDFVTPSEMYFATDINSFQIAPNIIPTSWKCIDLSVNSGFIHLPLDKQDQTKTVAVPKALFTLKIQKNGIRKILIIFIPLFASTYLGLFSLIINMANTVGRFSLAITAVTAILGYRFVIEQMMPQVGYLTTADMIYLLLFLITLICFIFQLFITRLYSLYSEKLKEESEEKRRNLSKRISLLENINSFTFIFISVLLTISISIIILI